MYRFVEEFPDNEHWCVFENDHKAVRVRGRDLLDFKKGMDADKAFPYLATNDRFFILEAVNDLKTPKTVDVVVAGVRYRHAYIQTKTTSKVSVHEVKGVTKDGRTKVLYSNLFHHLCVRVLDSLKKGGNIKDL